MKNISILLICLILCLGLCAGCGQRTSSEAPSGSDRNRLQIVATIFPEYDWIREILGENPAGAELTLLLDSGVDLHSFQPSAQDMLLIASCDLFIYVGGESDKWVGDALASPGNPDRIVINLMEVLGEKAREEVLTPGMQSDEAGPDDDADDHDGPEYDEHVWLSLRNASVFCDAITDALCTLDPDHQDSYKADCQDYQKRLNDLDKAYSEAVGQAPVCTLIFGDRFPFLYLTNDYAISYDAAFSGCSAETEASFETISYLASRVDDLGLHCVMTIEGTDHRIAQTIIQSTKSQDQQILTLNSMQSVTKEEADQGITYLSLMEQNLDVLKEALQ